MRRQRKLTDADALELVIAELRRAREKHPRERASAYEGLALIRAKADHLGELVDDRIEDYSAGNTRKVAIQVAAMALRFAVECT